MSAAIVEKDGSIRQLDAKAGEEINVTADDVKDPQLLARMLQTALRELAELKREWRPRRLYFRDLVVDASGTTKYRLTHNFGGKVNYYVAAVDSSGWFDVRTHADTDANALVLTSNNNTTITVLVEEAG